MLSSQEGMTGKINLGFIVIEYFVVVFFFTIYKSKKKETGLVGLLTVPGTGRTVL